MACYVKGLLDWDLKQDKDGHRDYSAVWLVRAQDRWDGPGLALQAAGLPGMGAYWAMGNETDPWAYLIPTASTSRTLTNEPGYYWKVTQNFSTRPLKRCQDDSIQNPLDEPIRLSGSFVTKTREVMKDRHGKAIKSSSHEIIRGQIVEFDDSSPTVKVGMNLMLLPLEEFAPMIHMVNDAPLWGLSARMVKLSNATWSRLLYGTCNYYYTVDYDFDINYKTFDRKAIDEGTKVLAPGGDPTNPKDFIAYKDKRLENSRVLLDGSGAALADGDAPVEIPIEYYEEGNLLSLGIPTSL